MRCEDAIKNGLCLGCGRLELENPNADKCEYRDKSGLEQCKKIIEGVQMRI